MSIFTCQVFKCFSLCLFITFHFEVFAEDLHIDKNLHIQTDVEGAAVYVGTRNKKRLVGFTPVTLTFHFRTTKSSHRIFLSKPGYKLKEHKIIHNGENTIELEKDNAIISNGNNLLGKAKETQKKVNKAVEKLFYRGGGINQGVHLSGKIQILEIDEKVILDIQFEAIDRNMVRKLRMYGKKLSHVKKIKELIRESVKISHEPLAVILQSIRHISEIDFIQMTLLYPGITAKLDYGSTERYEFFYESSEYGGYSIMKSGIEKVVDYYSDLIYEKKVDSIRFLFPKDRVDINKLGEEIIEKSLIYKLENSGRFALMNPILN